MSSMLPSMTVLCIETLAAVLPAAFLLIYIYRQDHVEKEPGYLLRRLALGGILAALCALVLELIGSYLLGLVLEPDSTAYILLFSFVVIAAAEEGAKLWFLQKYTWRDRNFNYRFDGIVYAVFVSLGFAGFENLLFILNNGLNIALSRALLAIPGHMGFAVFMGYFYGRARLSSRRKNLGGVGSNMALSYFSALLLHGFYDTCAMMGTATATALFVAFMVGMYQIVYHLIRHEAKNDIPLR